MVDLSMVCWVGAHELWTYPWCLGGCTGVVDHGVLGGCTGVVDHGVLGLSTLCAAAPQRLS